MNTILRGLAALSLLAVAPARADFGSAREESALRRVALAIGSHDGRGRERLMYAGSDAAAFRRTLEELGGLRRGDATLLVDPDSQRVMRAFDDLEERVRALKREGARVEAIVYYSGHANDKGLMLGRQNVDYRLFRSRMNALGADVRIAVVDACESGALTRLKGGHAAPAFLVDKSTRSEGYAILTSSSESEAAQESDRVGGSFFTHALNSGLRGAADASRDGRVTLHEAYQFAYNETLARTESTRGGPQHAGYDIQLNGSGDVVLTDIRQASAFLDLSEDLHGRLFIRDSVDHLAAELHKPAGREMRIGLSPGSYRMRLLRGDRWSTGTVTVAKGQAATISPASFRGIRSEPTVLRGDSGDSTRGNPDDDSTFQHVPNDAPGGFSSALIYDRVRTEWRGVQLAPVGTGADSHLRGGQLALGFNSVGGDLEGFQAALGANVGARSLHGTQFSNGANVVLRDLRGAQFSVGTNIAGGQATGFQGAVGFNIAGGRFEGWQISVGGNVAGESVKGGQASVGFNFAGDSVKGLQAAVGFNGAADSVRGTQLSVGLNQATGKVYGAQATVGLNIAGSGVKGGQGAVGANLSLGPVEGFQGALGFNGASDVRGVQVAGLLNVARKVNGTQIGLINISDEFESGIPVGLINISRKGSFEGEAWVDETGMAYAGLRMGVRWMHTHFAVGARAENTTTPQLFAPTFGVSAQTDFLGGPMFVEAGVMHSVVFRGDRNLFREEFQDTEWSRLRAGIGIKPLSFISIFGGLTLNASAHPHTLEPLTGSNYRYFHTWGDVFSLWPGAYAGIRIGK